MSKKKILILSLVVACLVTGFTAQGFAASWQDVTDDIEVKLNQALKQYQAGKVKVAKKSITDSYFGPFETQEMEQAIQQNIGGQNAFKAEYMFTQLKKLMDRSASQQEVENLANRLLKELITYAGQLDKAAPREDNSPLSKFLYSLGG